MDHNITDLNCNLVNQTITIKHNYTTQVDDKLFVCPLDDMTVVIDDTLLPPVYAGKEVSVKQMIELFISMTIGDNNNG